MYLFCRHTIFCSFELWIVLLQTKNHINGILLKKALTCRLNNLSVIDLSILRDACCELFCVFRDFNATGMQGTGPGVTNSLFIRRCCKLSGKYILWDLSQWDMAISSKESIHCILSIVTCNKYCFTSLTNPLRQFYHTLAEMSLQFH